MKKHFSIALAALMLAASASAEVQSPYTEQFDNPSFRPVGWLNILSSSYSPGSYTVNTEGGHSGGYITAKQYSSYFSSYYKNYSYCDLLATPKVSGDVSIWVRKNGSEPALTFYKLTDQNTVPSSYAAPTLVDGTVINMVEGVTIDDWTQITVEGVAADTYIGIRAHDLDLDEFTAGSADVTPFKLLYCKVDNQSGTTVNANTDNTFTLKFKVTMENAGDVDFGGNTPVTVTVINRSADNAVFGTGEITEALPRGVKVEKEFEITGTHVKTDGVKSYSYGVELTHPDMSTYSGTLGSLTMIPYEPNPKFMYNEANSSNQSSYNDVDATEVIAVGVGAAPSRTLWMWNSGIADMEVTAVTCTGDFAADTESFTLAPNEKKAVTVSASGDAGIKTGSITFTEATLGELTYDLSALVTNEDKFFEDFEGETAPNGWIFSNSWKVGTVPAALTAIGGEKAAEYTYATTKNLLITPKLKFGEGETLCFTATKKDNMSSLLTVYTSPDRVNWTPALVINARETEGQEIFAVDKPTGTGYGTYEFKIFSAPMPEGEVYVAFEAGGVLVDNVFGGEIVPVAHDLYVTNLSTPKDGVGSVNARFITSIALHNLADAETDYRISIFFDDKEIASSVDTETIEAGADKSFDIVATPHVEGTFTATVAFVKGDEKLDLASFEAVVGPEKAEATYQVGDEKITNTDPFNTGYAGVQTQILYPAEKLQMDKGVKITGVYFTGANNYDITKHIKVWAENTTDEEYPEKDIVPAPVADMTLVFDADYTFPKGGNTTTKVYEDVFHVVFDTPFEYTGNSLRLAFEMIGGEEGGYGDNIMFMVDNTGYDWYNDKYNHYAIVNKQRYSEDLEDEPSWSLFRTGIPASFFTVAKDIVVVKGIVSDDFGAVIEGAQLSFESGDILYTAVSDAEGAYAMNVANVNLVYTLTTTADDFADAVSENITLDAKQPEANFNVTLNWLDRTATLSGFVYDSNVNHNEPVGAGVEITLTSGNESVSSPIAEDGSFTLEVSDFSKPFAVSITEAGIVRYTNIHIFTSKEDTVEYYIAYSEINEIGTAAEEVEYFNLQGIKVAQPQAGKVYIRRAAGKAEKVLVK